MYRFIVFQCLIAVGYCITCKTTEGSTCTASDFCYEAFAKDKTGKCNAIRNCIDETFQWHDKEFRKNLINYEDKNPGLFKVCGTDGCNNNTPDCEPKVVDGGYSLGGIIGALIGGVFLGAVIVGLVWLWFKTKQ